jgi:hypothetical protein
MQPSLVVPIPVHPSTESLHLPDMDGRVSTDISTHSSGSGGRTIASTNFQQDTDIPREIFMRVGQFLLDEGTIVSSILDASSPLMSPDIHSHTNDTATTNRSLDGDSHTDEIIQERCRSRSSSLSSISSNQSFASSTSSYVTIPYPATVSGVYINYTALGLLDLSCGE